MASVMEPSTSESNDQARRKHPQTVNHTVAARLQALTLAEHGVPKAIAGAKSGMSEQSVTRLMKKARLRGYNPEVSTIMKEEYVTDGARPGRRLKVTPEKESAILASVREDANGREKPSAVLANEHGVSSTTVLRILKKNQVKPFKITKNS